MVADSNSGKIGWGILGNATVARLAVAPAIAASTNGYVAAVGSRHHTRALELTRQHGGAALTGYEAVLVHPLVDAVYIPLPNHLHKEWALKALAAGKHVLVEKPFALNAGEALTMATAARTADRHLAEAFMWRFHPRAVRIKQLVADGELGRIASIRAAFTFLAEQTPGNERLFSSAMGGGSLWDVGSYGVSLARWLLDEEPERVSAQAIWHENGVDTMFAGTLQFASGVLAVVESGLSGALQQTFSISGDGGAIEFAQHDAFIPGKQPAAFQLRGPEAPLGESVWVEGADQYQLMVEQFADVILTGTFSGQGAEDSIKQMKVLDALLAAARTGQTITL